MRTIAFESRAYVLSANQCVKRKHLPDWITGGQIPPENQPSDKSSQLSKLATDDEGPSSSSVSKASDASGEEFVSRGGSCIVGPDGSVLAGPLWEVEDGGLLSVAVDFEDCERGRLDLDVAGSYGRGDAFRLEVEGLDLSPPP